MNFDELDDPTGPPTDAQRRDRVVARAQRRQLRRRAIGATLAAVSVLVPLTVAVVNRNDRPTDTQLATRPVPLVTTTTTGVDGVPDPTGDEPVGEPGAMPTPTTAVTLVAPPTVTAPPAPSGPAPVVTAPPTGAALPVVADPANRWQLVVAGQGGARCVQLVVGGRVHGSLLCGAKPAESIHGDLVSLDTSIGRMVVVVVDPSVTGFAAYPQAGGRINLRGAAGPDRQVDAMAYAAGEVGGSGVSTQLIIEAGAQRPAKLTVPPASGVVPAGAVEVKTTGPYGVWPGYRKAGFTGFLFAGNQEVGFYDGPGDKPCLLYRRFTGPAEALLLDQCGAGAKAFPSNSFAELLPTGVASFERYFLPAIVSDVPLTSWRCELSTGRACGGAELLADPKGSGRTFLFTFAGLFELPPGGTMTAVLLDGATEFARYEVKAP